MIHRRPAVDESENSRVKKAFEAGDGDDGDGADGGDGGGDGGDGGGGSGGSGVGHGGSDGAGNAGGPNVRSRSRYPDAVIVLTVVHELPSFDDSIDAGPPADRRVFHILSTMRTTSVCTDISY